MGSVCSAIGNCCSKVWNGIKNVCTKVCQAIPAFVRVLEQTISALRDLLTGWIPRDMAEANQHVNQQINKLSNLTELERERIRAEAKVTFV